MAKKAKTVWYSSELGDPVTIEVYNYLSPLFVDGFTRDGIPVWRSQLRVSCDAFSDGVFIDGRSTPLSTLVDGECVWNATLALAVKWCDLALASRLDLTVWDCGECGTLPPVALTAASQPLFSGRQHLKARTRRNIHRRFMEYSSSSPRVPATDAPPRQTGARRLVLSPAGTPPPPPTPEGDSGWEMARLERLLRRWDAQRLTRVTWLDDLSLEEVRRRCRGLQLAAAATGGLQLNVELPTWAAPVAYAPRPRPPPGGEDSADWLIAEPGLSRGEMAARKQLVALLTRPPSKPLTPESKALVWRCRLLLQAEKRALGLLLRAVPWGHPPAAGAALDLMKGWAPFPAVDVTQAVELLSPALAHVTEARAWAAGRLAELPDDSLRPLLLPLVQGLRHERGPGPIEASPLARLLIARGVASPALAAALHWFLLVACADCRPGPSLARVHSALLAAAGAPARAAIRSQSDLVAQLGALMRELRNVRGPTERKRAVLATLLAPGGRCEELTSSIGGAPCPLGGGVTLRGLLPGKCTVFRSALHPLLLCFRTGDSGDGDGPPLSLIYKAGDDLRQDQLCTAVIALMDGLLRKSGLDLRLTPYAVLATAADEGLLEYVPAMTLAHVLAEHRAIAKYLAGVNPDPSGPYGMRPETLDALVRSCAGYCVVTYVLAVGDRHLDNLMLCPDGRLFHIDFGFILGRDPKPFPPPMKLCREMVEAMGGADSPHYARFGSLCREAYTVLRRSAGLLLGIFHLVAGATPDLAVENAARLEERLRLDLDDEAAGAALAQVIAESSSALFPQLVENAHRWAQYWR